MNSDFKEYLQSIIGDDFSAAVALLCEARELFLAGGKMGYLAEWEQLIFMMDTTLLPEATAKQNFKPALLAELLQLSAEVISPVSIDCLAQQLMGNHSDLKALHARYLIFATGSPSEQTKGLRLLEECLTEDNITAHECARRVYEFRLLGEETTAQRWGTHVQSSSFRRIWNECEAISDDGNKLREIRSCIACGLPDMAIQKAKADGSAAALFLQAEAECLSGAAAFQIERCLRAAAEASDPDAERLLKALSDAFLRRPDTLKQGRYSLSMLSAELQRRHNRFERLKASYFQDLNEYLRRKEEEKASAAKEQEPSTAAPASPEAVVPTQPLPPSQMRLSPKKKLISLKKQAATPGTKKGLLPPRHEGLQKKGKTLTLRNLPWRLLRLLLHGVIAWLCWELVLFVCLFNRISEGTYKHMWILSELLIKIGTGLLWMFIACGGVFSVWSCFSLKKKYGLRASTGIQLLTILQLVIALQMLAYTTLHCNGFISAFFSLCCFGVITLLLIFYKGSTVTDKQQAEECYIKLICLLILCEIFLYGCFEGAFNLIENLQTLHGLYRI